MNRETRTSLFSLWVEDYRTNGSDWFRPGFRALAAYRFGVWRMQFRFKIVRGLFSLVYRILYRRNSYVYGIEIPYTAQIGRRVTIEHQHGIVVHGASVVGDECILRHGVTLGIRSEEAPFDAPQLGHRVSVGAGAKILGRVRIGDDVKIGANAVVLCDVPDGCVAIGVPAKILAPKPTGQTNDGRSMTDVYANDSLSSNQELVP